MPEGEASCRCAGGAPDDLVAEADPEEREASINDGSREGDRPVEARRVARAWREDNSLHAPLQQLRRRCRMRMNAHTESPCAQRAYDVRLEAEVDDGDAWFVWSANLFHPRWRDESNKVFVLPAGERTRRCQRNIVVGIPWRRDARALCACFAEAPRKASRLDASNCGNPMGAK
jgi:hypothetical protein